MNLIFKSQIIQDTKNLYYMSNEDELFDGFYQIVPVICHNCKVNGQHGMKFSIDEVNSITDIFCE